MVSSTVARFARADRHERFERSDEEIGIAEGAAGVKRVSGVVTPLAVRQAVILFKASFGERYWTRFSLDDVRMRV